VKSEKSVVLLQFLFRLPAHHTFPGQPFYIESALRIPLFGFSPRISAFKIILAFPLNSGNIPSMRRSRACLDMTRTLKNAKMPEDGHGSPCRPPCASPRFDHPLPRLASDNFHSTCLSDRFAGVPAKREPTQTQNNLPSECDKMSHTAHKPPFETSARNGGESCLIVPNRAKTGFFFLHDAPKCPYAKSKQRSSNGRVSSPG
jgi:hypothetical protein